MRLPLVLLLLTIAACSSGGSASSSSSTIDGGAQCSSVMVDGATFTVERFHAGCTDGNTGYRGGVHAIATPLPHHHRRRHHAFFFRELHSRHAQRQFDIV